MINFEALYRYQPAGNYVVVFNFGAPIVSGSFLCQLIKSKFEPIVQLNNWTWIDDKRGVSCVRSPVNGFVPKSREKIGWTELRQVEGDHKKVLLVPRRWSAKNRFQTQIKLRKNTTRQGQRFTIDPYVIVLLFIESFYFYNDNSFEWPQVEYLQNCKGEIML